MSKLSEIFAQMSALHRHLLVASAMLGTIWVGAVWVFSPHIAAMLFALMIAMVAGIVMEKYN